MAGFVPTFLLVSSLLWGQADTDGIAKAVKQLGDDRFAVREAATHDLWHAGVAAEPALEAAVKSDDMEVRHRAASVLERFKIGLYPDVSPAAGSLVWQFRSGNQQQKLAAITKLHELGEIVIAERLVNLEPQESTRKNLEVRLRAETDRQLVGLFQAGKFDEAQRLLERFPGPQSTRRLVTLHYLQGNLSEAIARWEERVKQQPTDDHQHLLAELYRAAQKHDLADQIRLTKQVPTMQLEQALLHRHWAEGARLLDEHSVSDKSPSIDDLGLSAVLHRLAGEQELYEKRIAQLLELGEQQPAQAWHVYEILLLNERTKEAIERFKSFRPSTAFELLCVRQQFAEAFDFIGLKPTTKIDMDWFNRLPQCPKNEGDVMQRNQQYLVAIEAAFFLFQLGERDRAQEIFQLLRNDVLTEEAQESARKWREGELCRIQFRLGLVDEAYADAAHFTKGGEVPERFFGVLFPEYSPAARSWWQWIANRFPDTTQAEKLAMVRSVMTSWQGKSPHSADELLAMAKESFDSDRKPSVLQRYKMVMDSYLARNQPQLGIEYAEARISAAPGVNDTLNYPLGNLYLLQRQYGKAAEEFARLAAASPGARYLQGHCEIQSGKEESGKQQQQIALILAGDDAARVALWHTVKAQNITEEQQRLYEVFERTSPKVIQTLAGEFGDLHEKSKPALAADLWQGRMLELHRVSVANPADSTYVYLPHAQHRARARHHLAQGNREAFTAELALAQQTLPDNWELVEEFVPQLQKLGWTKEADAIFSASDRRVRATLKDFPRSTRYLIIQAWNLAITQRDLPDALQFALKAVELAPDRANHHHTLAEVYQLLGEREKAIAALQRAAELEPQTKSYVEKLQKLQQPATANH